ncbi:MAG: right-handed parallel beta-helix repeat-containing protein [Verrucomicrobiae bacterium]|nr:right-handed parallel beta-helix repeat-containing protein [Verrucomicrobiae bacterium]
MTIFEKNGVLKRCLHGLGIMMFVFWWSAAGQASETAAFPPRILYVNNLLGNDQWDGLAMEPGGDGKRGPLGSIRQAFLLAQTSDRIEVANTGKPYFGNNSLTRVGGTVERPLVINGNGALISGLGHVPGEKWKRVEEGIFAAFFVPHSNQIRQRSDVKSWIVDHPQIWWLDGKPGVNCKSAEELRSKEQGFYWNKERKEVWVRLSAGKTPGQVKIEMPVGEIAIAVNTDFVTVRNFRSMFSLDDGFDSHRGKNIVFQNCVATDECDQGFSCHGWSNVLYEDCLAERCAGSGSCDVHQCHVTYRRCVFVNNTFEAGVYVHDDTTHGYEDCLIAGNRPFEQVWARGRGKMNFFNSVLVGGKGSDQGIMLMQNGSVYFEQCTLADAPFICQLDNVQHGLLGMRNCILTRFSKMFFAAPESARQRLLLENNVYFDGPGVQFGGKMYGGSEWREYQTATGLDKESAWVDPQLKGRLQVELPKDSPLFQAGKRFGRPACVGAVLPASVWELYEKTRGEYATPEGIKRRDLSVADAAATAKLPPPSQPAAAAVAPAKTPSIPGSINGWPAAVRKVEYPSPADQSRQPALFYQPAKDQSAPLLVALHTWSSNYLQPEPFYAVWCIAKGWNFT